MDDGITTFRAYVLGENRAMLSVLDRLGPMRTERQRGVHQIDVDLTDGVRAPAEAMTGRVVRAVTGKHLPAMHTTAPPLWLSDDSGGSARRTLHEWLDRLPSSRSHAQDTRDADDEP